MKKLLTILVLIMLIISFFQITSMYALYKDQLQSEYATKLGVWSIKVNEADISSGEQNLEFNIDQLEYIESDYIQAGKIAPGGQAYFDIVIDPTNTDVSIIYQIDVGSDDTANATIDLLRVENYFKQDVEEGETAEEVTNENIYKDGNSYTSVITVNIIKDNYKNYVRLYFEWVNIESNNQTDSTLAETEGATISIPVSINLKQYIGEGISNGS